ncbi:MAG: DUF1761 domain-containing protein [Saprospiraceae bacterium]|nr:DUF1761 domain-containing protein [Saprospiraceae bacterium]MBL0111103.1 DUF1761 domain-containing protein [Saprospiraceae bacterium]MBP7800026.1 DUF1761 domain-containing protein [Saprospiraceae bacterium]MBP8094191.1 DUF1761 domain-containing protein [Saprospiraceae bacterium]
MDHKMNMLAVAVATLMPMIVGFIYYHPKVAGGMWMKANGFTLDSIGNGPKPILYVGALVLAFFLAMFCHGNVTGPDQWTAEDGHSYVTFAHGLLHGFGNTIMVVLPILGTMAIFEKRSWQWLAVNCVYWLITLALMCGILSAWR